MNNHKPLDPDELYQSCDLTQLKFESTAEIEPLGQLLGQERALEAIEFSVDIEQDGFNLFVLGPAGLGKHRLVKDIIRAYAQDEGAEEG